MFENEFFPTPDEVAELMWSKVEKMPFGSKILDPQAGAGKLLEQYIEPVDRYDRRRHSRYKIFAIELDIELRMILASKGITIIGSNFLTYDEPVAFDLIISNPPFSNGCKHWLKAWDMLASNGQFVCLLNKETIVNPCTKERLQLLQILKDNDGKVINMGRCFASADRPTNVEVVMVCIKKPTRSVSSINFDANKFTTEELESPEFLANPLAHNSPIKNLVARYKIVEQLLIDRYKQQQQIDFYLKDINKIIYHSRDRDFEESLKQDASLETQIKSLKSRFWNTIFQRTKMGSRTTSTFRKRFDEFAVTQSDMQFTEDNIMEVLMMFFVNKDDIMKECLIEVFDRATSYHDKNKVYPEGWKTNKSWYLNRRIILPGGVSFNNLMGFQLNHYQESFLTDLDKVMEWLSGASIAESETVQRSLRVKLSSIDSRGRTEKGDYKDSFESKFFTLRIFKKGTVWIDFKDQQLLDRFNKIAGDGKKWLGSDSL